MLADKRQEEYGVNGNDTEEKRRPALGVVEVEQQGKRPERSDVWSGDWRGFGASAGEGLTCARTRIQRLAVIAFFVSLRCAGLRLETFFACKGEQAKLGEEQGREVLGKTRRSAGREWVASVAKAGHRQRK
ncbi:hypothetical protein ERJ75_000667600 [Trypanosoma vivax]|nr:hypothetical protein ERJ75_000667600 [Trypanosoma vivax]